MVTEYRKQRRAGESGMWRFKGCPKCGGDLFVDYDFNGSYEECLQCGYLHDLKTIFLASEEKPEKAEKKELALAGNHRKTARNN